jgi:glycosyltransferase involved in cell wall biosynthesis
MKIALVCPASLPATQFGGILFLCVDIAKEAARVGHDVTIYTTDLDFANNASTFNKSLPRLESHDGFKINRTHVWLSFKLFFVNPKIYIQIKRDKPDIIHTIGVRSFQSLIAAIISKKYKIPLVISDQGGLTTHPDMQVSGIISKLMYKLQAPVVKFIVKQSTRIIVPNEYEREIFSKFSTLSKITTIRNGINLDQYSIELPDFKTKYKIDGNFVLFVGRFARVKGVDILLKAWNEIKEQIVQKNVKLVIMGVNFGFESQMLKMISDLGLSNSVSVIKNPPRQDVLAAYSSCIFLTLPSRWELSPLTPLEGFAFKKTVISTTAHGIPYTIDHGKNSILVQPEDHHHLADSILKLIDDQKTRTDFGENGYKLVCDICNARKMTEGTLNVYEIFNTSDFFTKDAAD